MQKQQHTLAEEGEYAGAGGLRAVTMVGPVASHRRKRKSKAGVLVAAVARVAADAAPVVEKTPWPHDCGEALATRGA